MRKIQNFFRDDSGIETLEYAVIGAIIATVAVLIYGSGWGSEVKQQLLNAASQSGGTVST
jgi:Flp pilus assembly pilin Flp